MELSDQEIQSLHVIVMGVVFVEKTPGGGGLAWPRSRSTRPLLLQLSPSALVAPGPTENPRRARWLKDFLQSVVDPLKEVIVMDADSTSTRRDSLALYSHHICSFPVVVSRPQTQAPYSSLSPLHVHSKHLVAALTNTHSCFVTD